MSDYQPKKFRIYQHLEYDDLIKAFDEELGKRNCDRPILTRLARPENRDILLKLIDIAVEAYQDIPPITTQKNPPVLLDGLPCIFVEYVISKNDLKDRNIFPSNGFQDLFEEKYIWKKHVSRFNIEDISSNRIFLMKQFSQRMNAEDAITEMDFLGYHPANHFEALAYVKSLQYRRRHYWIYALGSSVKTGGFQYISGINSQNRLFAQAIDWENHEFSQKDNFLFVKK